MRLDEVPETLRNGEVCPFCDGRSLRRFRVPTSDPVFGQHEIGVVECRACLTGWQWPTGFSTEETQSYYQTQYSEGREGSYFDHSRRSAIAHLQMDFVESARGGCATLLDVGAGDGTFVSVARERGWEAKGVDLSYASEHVLQGTIADVEGRFDVITMWDVIEHVENPREALAAAMDRRAEGGMLVVETGNYAYQGRVLTEAQWWGYHPDHRWFFSPATVEGLLNEVGLRSMTYSPHSLRPQGGQESWIPLRRALRMFARRAVKQPGQLPRLCRQVQEFRRISTDFPALGAVQIFTVVARV